ncbi:MAG: nucleotidyltransferase domain-containing protein [Candidatus Competibacteraceae bacterium]|nr:nucleotidyltransferase domain-containing protein [Candidatus Competibacteraceae bacterium]
MLTVSEINAVASRLLVETARPAKVIVFGSYARGTADENSDLDVLVVEKEVLDKAGEYLRLKAAVGRIGVGVDLLLMSESEFERRRQVPGTVPYWASQEGRGLHDTSV